jgi:hypothetical protein
MKKITKIACLIPLVTVMAFNMACRTDKEPEKGIEKIQFAVSSKSLYIGEITVIGMSIYPAEVKNKEKVLYSVSKPGIVDIKEGSDNDGVIIEAKNQGTVVITGKAAGFVDYCSITVNGGSLSLIPHIVTPVSVLEVPVRERRSVTVSLAGGTPADNGGFIWTYSNQNVISLNSTGNVCVFDTLETGSSVITVRHPKAQYSIDILVFVLGSGENPVYITSVNNVINLNKSITNYDFEVELAGGTPEDNGRFVYQTAEGANLIKLNGNGKYGTITPVAAGLAVVRITHPKARYYYDIQVTVSENLDFHYIDASKSLVLLQEGENAVVETKFIGEAPGDVLDKFDFTVSESGIVSVSRAQGLFFITALQKGKTILAISNKYADFEREILIVVNNPYTGVVDNQKYIYTNQNIITMEAEGSDAVLRMTLVGGNEADRNNFVWTVDDSSVIETRTEHGKIQNRLMYENMSQEQFEAQAIITPKKTGTAKITLSHPKSKNEGVVIIKVYPKKTFASVPVVLGGKPYYKVERGKSLEIELAVDSGDAKNIGNLQWLIDNGTVAEAENTGLNGIIKGLSNGITNLTVQGGNLKSPFSAVVIVNSENEINNQKFIYVFNPFITLPVGQSMTMSILGENLSDDDFKSINCINGNSLAVQMNYSRNQMVLTALKPGKSEILVKGGDTNEIKITVTVEELSVNAEQPFYLTYSKDIIGVVKNMTEDIEVSLTGGGAAKYESGIIWSVENGGIAKITGNGNKARITGLADGQTVINVSHAKSVNALRIVVFVVTDSVDLNNKVVLYTEKNNYLLERGERVYIPLLSSASETQKKGIQWSIDNPDIIDFTVSSDNMAVFITCLQTGVARISVTHSQNIIPQVIYVSVVSRKQGIKYINVPTIIETVAGNNIAIQAITQNLDSRELEEITWRVDNPGIAFIAGNGETCLLQAKTNGSAVITVELKSVGFTKNIIVYIYSSYEEMAQSYIMGIEQSFYRINKGDVIDITLAFGAKGFPEHELNNIRWSAGGNNVVSVAGNGKRASIKALNTGIAHVYAESETANNRKAAVEIEVVETKGTASGYHFDIAAKDRIKGLVNGAYADILVKLFHGTTEVLSGLNKMEFEAEDPGVIALTVIDNNVRVTAKKTGRSYITIKHPSVAENERILIYTADSQNALDAAYPLSFEKNNYLLRKGDITRIKAETIDNDEFKINRITFEAGKNGVISIAEISKREISVSALEKGNEVIIVKYDNEIVQRIYVSVTLTVDSDLATYLVTENIIGMVAGRTYETKVNTNLQSYMQSILHWSSGDPETINVESFEGVTALLRAKKPGKTYVTVKSGNIERKILVFAAADEAELKNYQAINIDQRYFVINKGQSMSLNLFSYQGKVQGITQYGDYYNVSGDFGSIIELSNKTAESVTVNGRQEGIAGIRITNSWYNSELIVYVEVQNNGSGTVSGYSSGNYITARQTLLVIEPHERNVQARVDVIGGNFYQYGYFSWEGYDGSVIEVKASGNEAVINPVKTGQTVITVRNAYCDNELQIMVIVGNRYSIENTDEPYLYIDKTVYDLSVADSAFTVHYEVRNCVNYDYKNVNISVSGNSANVNTGNPGKLIVTPMYGGLTTVKIKAFPNVSIDVYFIVREKELGDIIYLTTVDNYIISGINEIKYVDIRLVGYDEIDSNQFKWSVDKSQVAQVMGNGTRGQIYPAGEGEAVITVTHHKARFPLTIHARITKNAVANQLVYLTTPTNVIEGLVGEENYVYVRKIGGRENLKDCTWTVDDPTVVSISGNEYTGTYRIKKSGVTRINVTNTESLFPLQIVVVAKEKTGSPLFIASGDTLLSMVPGELNRRVSVELAGGAEADNSRFNWSVYYQNPVDIKIAKNNGNVVTLTANANQCNITAVNEGVARIRIAHEKADNPLYITVQVSKYKQIEFPFNEKHMAVGESEFIRINTPNYENFKEKLIFVSDNPAVCTMVGTSSTALLTAHGKGYAVVKAKIEGMDQEAELYVTVVETEEPDTNRIVTGRTSYSFNPRSGPQKIKAALCGLNIEASDNDNIWWEIANFDASGEPVVNIYPAAAMNKELGSSEIQISPRREGEVQIIIGHRFVHPKYYKTINVLVSEVNNALTLDKNLIMMEDQAVTLKASIIGAKIKDYDEIVWEAEKLLMFDGTRKEVVRIMGEGQNVSLMPINDGTAEIMARYRGFRASCKVTVRSQYYFSVQVKSLRLYPGETVDINYDIRPSDSIMSWYAAGQHDNAPIVKFENIESQKKLRITGINEGSVQITGTANGRIANINVYVRWNYNVVADAYLEMKPVIAPSDKPGIIKYRVYPPTMKIEAQIPNSIADNITLDILNPVDTGNGFDGEGIIYISAKKEIPETAITWILKKSNGEIIQNVSSQTIIKAYFSPKENITPYFVRNFGVWSNAKTGATAAPVNGKYIKNGVELGENLYKNGAMYDLDMGDGEEHYIVFDKMYDNSTINWSILDSRQLKNLKDAGVEVELVDIVHNGNSVKALRVSGGKDSIEYDRVMFNKMLYVDVASQDYIPSAGSANLIETVEQSYSSFSFSIPFINGFEPRTRDLWDDYDTYQTGKDRWYFYLADQYQLITQYYPDNFTRRADLPNPQLIILPDTYQYASRTEKYFFSPPENSSTPVTVDGVLYDIPIRESGYFYSQQVVNDPIYAQLFALYTPLSTIPHFDNGSVYKEQIIFHYQEATYTYKDIFAYEVSCLDDINSSAVFEDFQTMREDQYGNKAAVIRFLRSYFDDLVEYDLRFENYIFSFSNYTYTLTISLPSQEGVSTWNVFHPSRKNSWSNTWSISPAVKMKSYSSSAWLHEFIDALYFEYEGLKRTWPYIKQTKYKTRTITYNWSAGDGIHSGSGTTTVSEPYTETNYISPEINKTVFFYHWANMPFADLLRQSDDHWIYPGNSKNMNIFNSDPVNTNLFIPSIPSSPRPTAHNVWSRNFVLQALISYYPASSPNSTLSFSFLSGGLTMAHGTVRAKQKYRWEDSPYNVIVPIERMLQFPLYVYYNEPDKNKTALGSVYEIDEFVVPFRAMHANDKRLSDVGVTSMPMPSIDTTPSKIESPVMLTVKYSTFDNTFVSLTFNITKKTRICHARYDGKAGEPGTVTVLNTNIHPEIQGITDWEKLESKKYSPFSPERHRVFVEKEN